VTTSSSNLATWLIFGVVYAGLAIGKLPFLRLDRAGIALVGATAMLVLGLLSFPEAVASVDFATLALLFGMMIVVAYLRLGGFFRALAGRLLAHVQSPHRVLAAVVAISGALSAFLVNDVVCLALVPVVLGLARRIRRDPKPYLVALATAANIGSVATITGNPQNMIIGALSHVPYALFAWRLAPIALGGLALNYAALAFAFRTDLARDVGEEAAAALPDDPAGDPDRALLPKGVLVLVALVVAFFAGAPVELAALAAAAVLMLGRVRPERLYSQVDWNLLVMFTGLFAVVGGFERHVVSGWDLAHVVSGRSPLVAITLVSAALSNLVSNVPAVLLLKSLVTALPAPAQTNGWLALAMASTLSGNLTPIASVANLIVLEGGRRAGVRVSFWTYCRVGVPVTLATLLLGALWLAYTR
jgi:Na+/H+ antiporter NhaD/arsenite permease-like protein